MKKRLTLFFACMLFSLATALAQNEIIGTVLSQDDGQPVIGAAVQVEGTKIGVVTDSEGKFRITPPHR